MTTKKKTKSSSPARQPAKRGTRTTAAESHGRSFSDMVANFMARRRRYHEPFKRLFGVDLGGYWDNITGFDVVKFDDHVKPGKNESSIDAVRRQWGQEGVDMILKLLV
jgi:hypothetical protein